jgi:hypothetical protein
MLEGCIEGKKVGFTLGWCDGVQDGLLFGFIDGCEEGYVDIAIGCIIGWTLG